MDFKIMPSGMNLCNIDLTSHVAIMKIIINQYFVAFDSSCTILKEFKAEEFSNITSDSVCLCIFSAGKVNPDFSEYLKRELPGICKLQLRVTKMAEKPFYEAM